MPFLRRSVRPLVALASVVLAGPAAAQSAGTCAQGTAAAVLEAGEVRAGLYNVGSLFRRLGDVAYEVPRGNGTNAMSVASFLMGGRVGDSLRVSGYTERGLLWPGPLGADGAVPTDESCQAHDRIWSVTLADVAQYNATGIATPDLAEWPAELGAPVVDGDGDPTNYDLAAGDRPAVRGTQTAWWILNDRGGPGLGDWDGGAWANGPVGVEVRVTASAVSRADAEALAPGASAEDLAHATHFRYEITKRGPEAVEDAYVGFFLDPDVGVYWDDYVGSDPSLGMVYAYNDAYDGDPAAPTPGSYGDTPPAVGVMVRSEPEADGTFLTYLSGAGAGGIQRPRTAAAAYHTMRGYRADGAAPWTVSPDGVSGTEPTAAVYSGAAPEYWSMLDVDAQGGARPADSYNMLASQGPFQLSDGDTVVIETTIAWARSAAGHLESVRELVEVAAPAAQALPLPPPSNLSTMLPGEAPRATSVVPVEPQRVRVAPSPNPSVPGAGVLQVSWPVAATVRVRVIDMLGRVVQDQPIELRGRVAEVPIAALAPGVYAYAVSGPAASGALVERSGTFTVAR